MTVVTQLAQGEEQAVQVPETLIKFELQTQLPDPSAVLLASSQDKQNVNELHVAQGL